jgi:hypothetical protein
MLPEGGGVYSLFITLMDTLYNTVPVGGKAVPVCTLMKDRIPTLHGFGVALDTEMG